MSDFIFDDYFADDKEGVEETVEVRGKQIPVRLRSSITLAERAKAKQAAVKKHIDLKGQLVYDGVDEDELQAQLLAVMVTEWPFTYGRTIKRLNPATSKIEEVPHPKAGQKVPISVDACRKLDSMVADAFMVKIRSIIEGPSEEALAPSEPRSDEDSTDGAAAEA